MGYAVGCAPETVLYNIRIYFRIELVRCGLQYRQESKTQRDRCSYVTAFELVFFIHSFDCVRILQ